MTQSQNADPKEKTSPEATTSNAESRAQQAEEKVQQLEKTVAELKARTEQSGTRESASTTNPNGRKPSPAQSPTGIQDLRAEPMMAHLMDSLEAGKDIGHYGRLVFAMIAHHFLAPDELIEWLTKDPDFSAEQAQALLRQVESRDYNPPRRERILAWQAQQDFPILPNVEDPDCGNVYRNLKFPDKVYNHIQEYQEEKAEAQAGG
jgi:hypothetical protein